MKKSNIVQGSWSKKIVSSCLQEERDKKDFEGNWGQIGNEKAHEYIEDVMRFQLSHPDLMNSHKFYDMDRSE